MSTLCYQLLSQSRFQSRCNSHATLIITSSLFLSESFPSNNKNVWRKKMNASASKGKFQIGQFKSLKQIFCKFEGQFDIEGQGQGHKVLKQCKTFR